MLKKLLIVTTILFLSACGGGGSSEGNGDSTATSINGTAATGAAFDGVVNIYGSNGGSALNVSIDTSGNYSADITGLAAPYFISAVSANPNVETLYSWASGPGVANITPFTALAMFYANGGQNPASLVNTWPGNAANVSASLPNSKAIVNANFIGVFSALNPALNTDFSSYDIFSSQFVIGDTFDQILDVLEVDVTASVPNIVINGSVFSFNPNINTNGPGTGNGGSTGLGSLTIAGADTSIFGTSFVPTLETAGSLGGTWSDQTGIEFKVLIFISSITGKVTSVTLQYDKFPNPVYGYEIGCSESFSAPDCSKITLDTNNKSISLDNVELSLDVFGGGVISGATAPITLNGTLFY